MAASANNQPKIELIATRSNHDPTTPTNNEPAMGYPPVIGYPQGDPRFPYGYPYPPPTVNQTHDSSTTQPLAEWQNLSRPTRYALVSIAASAVLLVTATVIVNIVVRPRAPEFLLSSFSVSNLTVSDGLGLLASWDGGLTVENRNSRVRLVLGLVRSYVYYEDPKVDGWLSSPQTIEGGPGLVLGTRSSGTMELNMVTSASWQPDEKVVEAVRDELKSNNTLVLNLMAEVTTKFRYSWWFKKHATEVVYCEDLVVEFVNRSSSGSSGRLAPSGWSRKCLLSSNYD